MNKQQVVEILVKWFSFILDDYSGKELYDNVADEIMALLKDEIADGDYTKIKASALRDLKKRAEVK